MAATSSIRSLIHAFPSIQTSNNKNKSSLLTLSALILSNPRTLTLKTTLKPFSTFLYASSFDSSKETEEFNYDLEEENDYEGEEVNDNEENEENEEVKLKEVSLPHEGAGRLYVGNLPYSVHSSQLAEIFSQAGTVENVEIVCDRVTDRSRGFAFVTMASNNDANNAIRMFDGAQIGGRNVKVNFPEVPHGGEREMLGPRTRARSRGYIDSPYKVYCGNLGWTVTSESLKDAFMDQPGLLGAKVIYEHDSGRSRGFGFVTFGSAEEAQSAIETMNGKEVGGRPLRLNLASERSSTPVVVAS